MHPSRRRSPEPILITAAPTNADDQFDRRRRRYLAMMALRAVCVVGAALTVTISGWLAAAFMVGALVLPWTAVLIANDRPPRKATSFRRFLPLGQPGPRELTDRPAAPPDGPSRPGGAAGPDPAGARSADRGPSGARPDGARVNSATGPFDSGDHPIIDL